MSCAADLARNWLYRVGSTLKSATKLSRPPKAMTILTIEDLRSRLNHNSLVLWRHQRHDQPAEVETANVLAVRGDQVDLIWLEGYKSRNDTVALTDVLSLHDKSAPEMSLFPFNGKGYLTEAGQAWLLAHPREA